MHHISLLRWYQEYDLGQTMCFDLPQPPVQMPISSAESVSEGKDSSVSKEHQLKALYQELLDFKGCALAQTAEHTVFGDGDPHSPIMLVGEAPGAEEDRLGKPFVGLSGQLLTNMLAAIHLQRSEVYIANIIPWRPPFNRQPSLEEIGVCLPFIERHIAIINPKILVCLGSVACKALLKVSTGITALQKQSLVYKSPYIKEPIMTLALYHPAYLLRSPSQKRATWHQLLLLQRHLNEQNRSSF